MNLLKNQNLLPSSAYIDIGSYNGYYIEEAKNLYHCSILGFEPQKEKYKILQERYKGDYNIRIFNFAVYSQSGDMVLHLNEDGSTLYGDVANHEIVKTIDIATIFSMQSLQNRGVDLMKINVEGSEYVILDRMIEKNLITGVERFLIQWHPQFDIQNRQEEIRNKLLQTHNLLPCQPMWEMFDLKF